jgi:hypothetical protein
MAKKIDAPKVEPRNINQGHGAEGIAIALISVLLVLLLLISRHG